MMKVIIAGDYSDKNRIRLLEEDGQYASFLGEIAPIIRSADYSIVNLEMPIDCLGSKPELKCGCVLKGAMNAIEALKFAGFKLCTLANNHIMDLGPETCLLTKQIIISAGLDAVGVGNNLDDASKIKYVSVRNEILAIINCCEQEYSIADIDKAGACPLDPIRQFYQIQEAKANADYVLVIVHGGHEHYQNPSKRMQKTYRFFIDSGADAVVNHHQHCFCGYESYNGNPIFYGLGNFCFDDSLDNGVEFTKGFLVEINFSKDKRHIFDTIPYIQCDKEPSIRPILKRQEFDKKISELNNIVMDPNLLESHQIQFYSSKVDWALNLLEPYFGRLSSKLFKMNLLPRTLKSKRFLCVENMIECESHRDILLFALKKRYDELSKNAVTNNRK